MAFIEPNSTIVLMKGVPLDPTYENTLCWKYNEELASQNWYFFENTAIERIKLDNYSYLRKSRGIIKVQKPIEDIYNVNYMAFRNISFENKWFYAFVTKVEYINNETCNVYYDIDLIQTWYSFMRFNQCMIERQHSETDAVGDNIIDEGLETGEYVVNNYTPFDIHPIVVMAVTEVWDTTQNPPKFMPVNGNSSIGQGGASIYYHGCAFNFYYITSSNDSETARLNSDIELYTEKNKINAIVSLFIAPRESFDPTENISFQPINENIKTYFGGVYGYHLANGYSPTNKKLMTYPYNFLQVSNYQGSAVDFRYEFFSNPEAITFAVWGNRTPNPGIILYANNYKGMNANWEEIVVNQCYPICSFNNDTYKAWLAQNKNTLAATKVNMLTTAATGIGQALLGNPESGIGSAVSALSQAVAMMGKKNDIATLPQTQHGDGNGDLMYQAGRGGFGIYHKSITYDYAKRIDDFFTMYGYKQNKYGVPNLRARQAFTYIKTVGCSLHGDIPCDDAKAIEAIFNKGIRFWYYTKTFGDYSQDNSPIAP